MNSWKGEWSWRDYCRIQAELSTTKALQEVSEQVKSFNCITLYDAVYFESIASELERRERGFKPTL